LMPEISSDAEMRTASAVRQLIATHREAQDLIQVGAYAAGSDPRIDAACAAMPHIENFLRQSVGERTPFAETKTRLEALARSSEKGAKK